MLKVCFIVCALSIIACNSNNESSQLNSAIAAYSLTGEALRASPPSEKLLTKYLDRKDAYQNDPDNIDKLIWYGRFAAYKADYSEAIDIYTKGIEKFPTDPRLYRHRGHRYISIRKFDKAIEDLTHASKLIEGKANQVEPDGMPNEKNIPVSSLHGNIWYHLGLAHYLKNDLDKAHHAFNKCLNSGNHDDNVVSSIHWLYMIARKQDKGSLANVYLQRINPNMEIIENFSYHDLCLFYKGLKDMDSLLDHDGAQASNDAVMYGVANWYLYNGNREKAKEQYEALLSRDSWSSFGFITAESDYLREFEKK